MSEITENIKLELWDQTDVAKPLDQSPEFDYLKTVYNNFKRTDSAFGKDRQAINSEQNLLSGVEEVETLTSTGNWKNRTWRTASSGTGTRERITVENPPNSTFQKGWRITGSTGGNTDICQELVPITLNQSYKLSCYARKISGGPILRMQYGKNPYTAKVYTITNTEWQKYELILKVGETNANCLDGSTNIYFGISNCIGVLEICGLRLEKIDERIEELESKNKYLEELNNSLQETVLDTQTEIAKTVIVNDSCEGVGMVNIHGGQYQEILELPNTYQRVEYLESTGTQYIDTNYLVNSKTKIEVDFAYTDFTVRQGRIFGCIGDLVTSLYVNGSGNFAWACQNTTGNWTNMGITADTQKHHFELDIVNKTVKFDNTYTNNFSSISANNTASNTLSIYSTGDNRVTEHYSKAKVYNFKIYENNILVRNFVACYRKSDNVAGLYDLVNDVFYTNSGTGIFNVGTNKNNIIAPSLENSSEIEVVENSVKINITNENIVPFAYGTQKSHSGISLTIDEKGIATLNGTATVDSGNLSLLISNTDWKASKFPYNEKITFMCKGLIEGVTLAFAEASHNGGWLRNLVVLNKDTTSSIQKSVKGANTEYIRANFTIKKDTVLNNVKVYPAVILKETASYIEPKHSNLVLPFQKPFLEGDTFVRINGKWKEEHHWEKYIFDGTEVLSLQNENKRVWFRQSANSTKLKKKPICRTTDINTNEVPFCDILAGTGPSQTWAGTQGISYDNGVADSYAALDICIEGLTTVAEYQQALNGHYVWYKTREVEYIDCTEEQSKILDKINTYKNTTIITTDSDVAKVSLKYKVDVLKAIENATAVAESEE